MGWGTEFQNDLLAGYLWRFSAGYSREVLRRVRSGSEVRVGIMGRVGVPIGSPRRGIPEAVVWQE